MEILPHFWISDNVKNKNFILKKKIKVIIILSKNKNFIKNFNEEQIRIPLEKFCDKDTRNNIIYQHLFDVTSYINDKINNNNKVLLVGNEYDSDIINFFILAYISRYGKLRPNYSYLFLLSKKNNVNSDFKNYYHILNKFYNQLFNKS